MMGKEKLYSIFLASLLMFFFVSISIFSVASAEQTVFERSAVTEPQITDNQLEPSAQLLVSSQSINKLHGINFSPYIDGQNPNYGSQVSKEQITERMKIIAPYTTWIRSYGTENGLQYIGPVAHGMGLKTAIGAWLSGDTEANNRQISELINESKKGYVDLAIVGSETLLRNDLSEDQLIEYIRRVKQAAPGINVTTADTYSELLNHPKVIAECDVIMYNSYPYWEGISIDNSIEKQKNVHKSLLNLVKNKPIIVSETGWPSAGNTIGSAVPSSNNSARYFNDFVSWARSNNIQYFYFEAFDETWKTTNEGPQGAHWGIWDKNGIMKPGMENSFSSSYPIIKTPVANFSGSPATGTAPLNVSFTDRSTNNPTSWRWNFGDGTNSTSKNPVHKYSIAGNYTVTLTASNSAGSNTTTKTNYIKVTAVVKPVANFTSNVTSGYAPLSVAFTDKSTNNPTAWKWTFGDGTNSTAKNPVHRYSTKGNYTVSLTATNAAGSNTTTKTNYVRVAAVVKPVANFTSNVTSGIAPLTVSFNDRSINNPTSWRWTFGDGTNSTSKNPIHRYPTKGNYTVSLTATNVAGSNTTTKTNYIKVAAVVKPVANFTSNVTSGYAPLSVAFTDKSTNNPTAWKWTFGDGTNSTVKNPFHRYSIAGNYTVTLTASNSAGSNTVTKTNYIKVIKR